MIETSQDKLQGNHLTCNLGSVGDPPKMKKSKHWKYVAYANNWRENLLMHALFTVCLCGKTIALAGEYLIPNVTLPENIVTNRQCSLPLF